MRVDPEAWVLAAAGELGDVVCWKEQFKVIQEVRNILAGLEEVGGVEDIDWDALIGGFDYFRRIRDIDFPPLYNERAFEHAFDDFLCLQGEENPDDEEDESAEDQEGDGPTSGFRPEYTRIEVYIDIDKVDAVVAAFRQFLEHLRTVPQLRQAGLVQRRSPTEPHADGDLA